jgi:hypothetical protein
MDALVRGLKIEAAMLHVQNDPVPTLLGQVARYHSERNLLE